jgi:hypothetical protein
MEHYPMNSHEQIRAARARQSGIDLQVAELTAERARLDKHIADLTAKGDDDGLPCWNCTAPQSRDARYWLTHNQSGTSSRSASGLPFCCCRITSAQTRSSTVIHA